MKKVLILILSLFLTLMQTQAFELIMPTDKKNATTKDYAF